MLVSPFNFENDIWINAYMDLEKFKKRWVQDEKLVLPFTPLSKMSDSREGWGKDSLAFKEILRLTSNYVKDVLELGGEIAGCHSCTIRSLYSLSLDKNPIPKYEDLLYTFETYKNLLSQANIRCFFMTNSVQEAINSRYMWNLYGGLTSEEIDHSLLISINLKSLKETLESAPFEIEAGKIDYENDRNRLFYKDESYQHEKEFRLAMFSNERLYTEFLEPSEIRVTISGFDHGIETFFENLGFTGTKPFNSWQVRSLELDNEKHHSRIEDIEDSISLFKQIEPESWNRIMGVNS